ncbi:MAG: sigma-70 family RNA polymerase sigma factor [Pedobacter sp.]|jgi:RNA polymerase sigma-70 factor (family 1)|uniref:RNA polymerase sigma factor n=1 Tax=Pedobacter sp. TaxID=1411316 RepID=UPI003392729C
MDNPLDDTHLLIRIAEGDRVSFNELYRRHMHNVYSYIHLICKSRETTEEVVQDLFLKIWLNRKNLEHIRHFKPYLYRSARNLLLDRVRKSQVEVKAKELVLRTDMEHTESSDSNIICNQYKQFTIEAISRLPEKRKRIVELRTQEDLSLDEIAAQLSISKSVVKKQLYSGMNFVRDYIHKLDHS